MLLGPWVKQTAMEGKEPPLWRETLQKVNVLDLEDCLWSYPGVCQHNITDGPSVPTTVQFLNVGPKARIAKCVKRPMKTWYWFPFKRHSWGRGAIETAQWLKSLAVLPQDSGWVLSSHTVLYNDLQLQQTQWQFRPPWGRHHLGHKLTWNHNIPEKNY